jgi:uncharacterized membrane protein YeaQ/YmgE (transglycosylase-associated protein family)
MIHVPTAPWTHNLFDLAGWAAGAAVGLALYRWRLAGRVHQVAMVTGPGYFLSLAAGAAVGAWAAGSLNTLQGPAPVLSHSVAGALVGAIVAVEIYKLVRGLRGSTGAIFVGSFATGVIVGRWGCLFAGLPDRTYGVATTLPWGVDLGDGVSRHPVPDLREPGHGVIPGGLCLRPRRPRALGDAARLLCPLHVVRRAAVRLGVPQALSLGSGAV